MIRSLEWAKTLTKHLSLWADQIMQLRGLKRYQIKNTKITDNYRMTLNGGDLPQWLGNVAANDRVRLLGTLSSRGSLHQELLLRGRVKTGERPDLQEYRADTNPTLLTAKASNNTNKELLVRSCVLIQRRQRHWWFSVCCSGLATRCKRRNSC